MLIINKLKCLIEEINKSISVMIFFSKIAWRVEKLFFLYYFLGFITFCTQPFVTIVGMKVLIDNMASDERNIYNIILYTCIMVAGDIICRAAYKYTTDKKNVCNDKIDREIIMNIDDMCMKIKYEDTENPDMLDTMKKVISGYTQIGFLGVSNIIFEFIANFIIIIGVIYLILQCSIVLIILVFINLIITSIINSKVSEINFEFFKTISKKERRLDYFINKVTTYQYGKDVRIYDAGIMLLEGQKKVANELIDISQNRFKKMWRKRRQYQIINNVFIGATYTILATETAVKRITLGQFTSLINAVLQFSESFEVIIEVYYDMKKNTKILSEVVSFLKVAPNEGGDKVDAVDDNITIEFKNVSFKYPRSDEMILSNINLKISSGEHIAIVGENGSGKTTFIKILCRLYELTEGEILINGKNINQYSFDEYTKLLAVVFQDYKLFAFSVKDNIVLDDKCDYEDLKTLSKKVGIEDRILKEKNQYDTNLYKYFDGNGIDLSGGEEQKIAIVRALYKNAPLFILDEPTSALDPIAEYNIYRQINELVGKKTTIYISHRLSSCKFCDRILVFANKTIVEDGNHDELMGNQAGIYYKMFTTQAKYYQ